MEPPSPIINPAPEVHVENVPMIISAKQDTPRKTPWKTYINPEYLQPTIIAISATYIIYAVGALYALTPTQPAETQFANYVASLGLISGLLFYARFANSSRSYVSFMELAFITSSSIVIAVYIMYWCITPNFHKLDLTSVYGADFQNLQQFIYPNHQKQYIVHYQDTTHKPKFDTTNCIDSRKCSHPVHLVLQSAFMVCVGVSLVFSIIRRG